jgi:hypothetical protein
MRLYVLFYYFALYTFVYLFPHQRVKKHLFRRFSPKYHVPFKLYCMHSHYIHKNTDVLVYIVLSNRQQGYQLYCFSVHENNGGLNLACLLPLFYPPNVLYTHASRCTSQSIWAPSTYTWTNRLYKCRMSNWCAPPKVFDVIHTAKPNHTQQEPYQQEDVWISK